MSVYLDASVIVPTIVASPPSAIVHAFLVANREAVIVSDFAAAEVASALSRLVRTGELERSDAEARLATLDDWMGADTATAVTVGDDVKLAGALVRRFELMLRTPDALHLAICDRVGGQLITRDVRLAMAAGTVGLATVLL